MLKNKHIFSQYLSILLCSLSYTQAYFSYLFWPNIILSLPLRNSLFASLSHLKPGLWLESQHPPQTSLMSVCFPSGWGGVPGRNRIRGEQGSDLGPAEAAAAGHGPFQSGTAHLHPGATLFPGQAVWLLLSCWSALTVSNFNSLCCVCATSWWRLELLCAFFSCHNCVCFLHHRAVLEESAYGRMKQVLRWYLSGFYKKPKVRFVYYYSRWLVIIVT